QWRWNEVDLPGQTNTDLELADPQLANVGDYSVVVTNDCGAVTSQVARLTMYVPALFSALTGRWKFNQSGADLGAAWKEVAFDDASWPEGEALFYSGTAAVSLPKGTLLALTNELEQPINTYYFRAHFNFAGSSDGLSLLATNYVQNGAVFYLNGVELGRLRMPGGTISAASPAFVGPQGQAELLLFPASALAPGDNVVAVELHQQSAGATKADLLFGMALRTTSQPPPMPDLIVWPPLKPHIELCNFASTNCEVVEGCAIAGTRRLLRFDIQTRNIGTADLVLGDPAGNPLFVYAACHGHYHFDGYTALRLMNSNGVVAVGNKIGFALEDIYRWDTNAPLESVYSDTFQGIQRGWADTYSYWIPCQYIDITETPPGLYTLELEVDPDHKLAELNETNNVTRIMVEIPANSAPCDTPPPNDNFADAQVVPYAVATAVANSECATRERGEPVLINHFDEQGAFSVWFRWTAPSNGNVILDTDGSNFPPMVGLYSGVDLTNLTLIAEDIAFTGFPLP
ncbi:MAG TPA: lysyl oxidase family protein, partial [Candidatus Binatia bacterium]|nr:lysyl oxidase family protein [Candidatus Binatia bacterium]